MKRKTSELTVMAMLTAVAVVLVSLIHFPLIPAAPFLEYDPADIAILIAGFAYGPLAGLAVTAVAAAVQAFVLGSAGFYGFIMHVVSTGALVTVSASIYSQKRTRNGAIVALASGTVAMTVVMLIANYFVTPIYTGMPTEAVVGMLIPIILPFNLLKAGINATITFFVYKLVCKHIIYRKRTIAK